MKDFPTAQIRNVALAGHSHSGKTSLLEAILYNLKVTDRLGRTEDGTTVSDYDAEEVRRQISINASLVPVEHRTHKINFIDVPGTRDFIGEMRNAVRVADAMVIMVDATSGVEVGTELAYDLAEEFKLPRMFVINKINHDRATFEKPLQQIRDTFGCNTVLLNFPYGEATAFKGCINLLRMKLGAGDAGKVNYSDIPSDLADRANELRASLIEAAAEGDDELTAKFLDGETLTEGEVLRGLKEDLLEHRICPVITASATEGAGCMGLLDFIIECFPAPGEEGPFKARDVKGNRDFELKYDPDGPTAAFVFKTVSDPFAGHLSFFKVLNGTVKNDTVLLNTTRGAEERINHLQTMRGKKPDPVEMVPTGDIGVLSKLNHTHTNDTLCDSKAPVRVDPTGVPPHTIHMAIRAKSKEDEERIGIAMHRLIEQDPTLHIHRDSAIHQTILSGMGDTHLDVAVSRLKAQSKVEVELEKPRVAYRETITKKAEGQGKHKKQSGGRGQYGDCWIKLEPLPEGSGFEFAWAVVGGAVPTKYQPSVEKGLHQALERGIISGHRAVDIKAVCYDGSYHTVDSSDMAFQVAASKAFKNVAKQAGPIILEPIFRLKVNVPEQYMGDVMGGLNSKRGKILGMDSEGRRQIITAHVPQSEIFEYSKELRSITQGRGTFEAEYHHYERVPADLQAKIIAASAPEAAEED
ncbi:MAG: elongation factor G [Candidatus Sumerlaeaceae bacterium]